MQMASVQYMWSMSANVIGTPGQGLKMASVHVVKVYKWHLYTKSRSTYKWHLTKNMEMGWDTFLNKNRGDIYRLGIEVKLQFWNFCRSRLMKTLGFMVKHLSSSSDASQKQKLSPSAAGFGNYH